MSKKAGQYRKLRRRAAKLPTKWRDIVTSKFDPAKHRKFKARRLGTFGAASEVRNIDPKDWKPSS